MTLDEAKESIGRAVLFRPYPGALPEAGVITTVRGSQVFVLYKGDYYAKNTRPQDLELEHS